MLGREATKCVFITVFILFMTTACGGAFHDVQAGSQTSLGNSGTPTTIEAFKATLHPVLTTNCAACHGASQSPLFAVTDANQAYNALMSRSLINFTTPSASLIVQKIQLGHNGFSQSMATQLTTQITNWAGLINGAQPAPAPTPTPTPTPAPAPATNTYSSISKNILQPKCVACHGASQAQKNVRYDSYAATMKTVIAKSPNTSRLYTVCTSGSMPPQPSPRLSADELTAIRSWIEAGALNN